MQSGPSSADWRGGVDKRWEEEGRWQMPRWVKRRRGDVLSAAQVLASSFPAIFGPTGRQPLTDRTLRNRLEDLVSAVARYNVASHDWVSSLAAAMAVEERIVADGPPPTERELLEMQRVQAMAAMEGDGDADTLFRMRERESAQEPLAAQTPRSSHPGQPTATAHPALPFPVAPVPPVPPVPARSGPTWGAAGACRGPRAWCDTQLKLTQTADDLLDLDAEYEKLVLRLGRAEEFVALTGRFGKAAVDDNAAHSSGSVSPSELASMRAAMEGLLTKMAEAVKDCPFPPAIPQQTE